ncbi:efflux RND transporter periplasmic adaptor subunit [Betaproteobacteria bacterium SCN2]|jgi:Cu(I)/Ag(I) efflux system membrane fusion protein|nr:efflux RND transporter periplasmic adaptor subunit [Betaproteobacteria bacterium SCN2]
MKHSNRILTLLVGGSALLALGAAAGWWWSRHASVSAPAAMPEKQQVEGRILYWYDPMYPQQHFDKPGKSPFMDMDLVPKYADEGGEGAGVKIDPSVAQNLGVRLATVARVDLVTQLEATGLVGFNERDVAVVQSRAGGFVERVWPLAPGDVVRAGQPLAEFLVPEWAAAQYEFLAIRSSGDAALLAAARDRMRLLGMTEALIREVEQSGAPRTRHTLTAPIGGLLQSLDVRQGMNVMAGQTLARINGLGTVWLEVAVPEALAGAVRHGAVAQVRLAGFPEQAIEGRVTTILPALNEATRSLRVRIELPNHDGRLRPGLSAQVSLGAGSGETALAVPTEAVIRTGKRALVMVAGEEGKFLPVEVSLGQEIGERTVIVSGLAEGQKVVASGQFLIDSEASLSGVTARAAETADVPSAPALHEADAVIKGIDVDEVTLAHGPFKTLSMPGMTMAFPVGKPGLLKDLKVGDQVRVGVKETEDGLVVERIEKRGGRQ